MHERITVRQQRTLFQPCALCGEQIATGSTLVAVTGRGIVPIPRELRIAFGICIAQQRRRELCELCFGEVPTVADLLLGAA